MTEQLTRSMPLQSRAVPGLTRLSAALPLIGVIAIGLVASLSAFAIVWSWEARWARSNFVDQARDHARVLQSGVDQYLGKVASVQALFDASVEVDQDEFEVFTSRILPTRQNVVRIIWTPRVPIPERQAHSAEARASGLWDYEIKTVLPDGTYAP